MLSRMTAPSQAAAHATPTSRATTHAAHIDHHYPRLAPAVLVEFWRSDIRSQVHLAAVGRLSQLDSHLEARPPEDPVLGQQVHPAPRAAHTPISHLQTKPCAPLCMF